MKVRITDCCGHELEIINNVKAKPGEAIENIKYRVMLENDCPPWFRCGQCYDNAYQGSLWDEIGNRLD